ncbi:diguanylate cyclase [Pirellula sp. SH-Sr6A]|uniref:diguanylate cyclase n=1 Tax=Pirellula sp. SH-Sr6A TaxID=1632865 RepID=UPI0011BA6DED
MIEIFKRRGWERLPRHEKSRCARYGTPAAIASIDLDGFKEINDSQGHSKGDAVFVQANRAIRSETRLVVG